MDAYEATKIVFSRIQSLDPENAAKIMGVLLVQDHGEKEMIRLAFGPESLIQSVVLNARKDLGLLPPSSPSSILSRQNSARLLPRPPPLAISSPFSWVAPCGEELVDELQHHEPLSFLNEQAGPKSAGDDCHSPMGAEYLPYGMGWAQRYFGPDPTGLGWKPCLYFARGYCKNGSSCRFLHGFPDDSVVATAGKLDAIDHDLLFRSKSQRFMPSAAAALPYSPTGSLPQSPKCMNISFFLQQQSESQRAASATAAAAAALILGGDEAHKFMDRPRMERYDFASVVNPGSRQIYLTFPADSTFREEDVSNYFSIYGPVQDVRIPYQQKRMFGFVTFLYPQTVKLILAKGNPHFVCDARVLVKPYKEKGKVPDKYRKQLGDRGDFSGCTTPTGLDSRDPFDLQQLGARILCASNNQDALLRKKMEEHRELQQTIELQQRRFMDLQLLDLKRNSTAPSTTAVVSPPPFQIPANLEKVSSPRPARTVQEGTSPKGDDDFQERAEHNLPDSPFASPTKLAFPAGDFSSLVAESDNGAVTSSASSALLASSLLPATSTLETMASFKSCFFQIPRFSSGPGAVGL